MESRTGATGHKLAETIALADRERAASSRLPPWDTRRDSQPHPRRSADAPDLRDVATRRGAPGQVTGVDAKVVQHDCSTLGATDRCSTCDGEGGRPPFRRPVHGDHLRCLPVSWPSGSTQLHRARHPGMVSPHGRPARWRIRRHSLPMAGRTRPGRGVVEDYGGSGRYDPAFSGSACHCRVLKTHKTGHPGMFPWKGTTAHELAYEHFSVVMSTSRRMCFFSASTRRQAAETVQAPVVAARSEDWKAQQICDECYGNEPKFARGHMTRREDPIWGGGRRSGAQQRARFGCTSPTPCRRCSRSTPGIRLRSKSMRRARARGRHADPQSSPVRSSPLLTIRSRRRDDSSDPSGR